MKITKQRLKEIIKEELGSAIPGGTQGQGLDAALDALYQSIDILLRILGPDPVVQELEAQIKDIRNS
jgi:hypothetical protein